MLKQTKLLLLIARLVTSKVQENSIFVLVTRGNKVVFVRGLRARTQLLLMEPRRRPSRGGSVSGEHGGFVRRRSLLPTSPELRSLDGKRTIRTTKQTKNITHQPTTQKGIKLPKVEVKTTYQFEPRTWNELCTLEHYNSPRRGSRLPIQITWLPREAPRAPNARWHRSSPSATTVQLPPREASAEQAGGVGAGSK